MWAGFVGLMGVLIAIPACVHDLGWQSPPTLEPVCIQWQAEDGFLYQRQATFSSHKVEGVLSQWKHSHMGSCDPNQGGPAYRVKVCLANSSPCAHDRTTEVWPDQVDYYLEKYPGSHRGPCTSECSKHQDDCMQHGGISNWRQWMQWMREMCKPGQGGVCSQ